ncbi:FecR family protein [Sphingobacterium lactis]|uniref:FecR family protein n=1 Tax=Sphingobacterium lactis TaxID=797291 RepID=UPI003F822139
MNEIEEIIDVLKTHLGKELTEINDPKFHFLMQKYPFLSSLLLEVKNEDSLKESLSQYILHSDEEFLLLEDKLINQLHSDTKTVIPLKPKVSRRMWVNWISIASSIIIFVFAGLYLFKNDRNSTQHAETLNDSIIPGSNQAVLTFENGNAIELVDESSGIKVGKEIVYEDGTELALGNSKDMINQRMRLSIPKGGQYSIVLSDGSKVWLNAESSLSYPSNFSGKTREVELIGEGYFEVTANKDRPFIVHTSNEKVQVLGTEFNVESYVDNLSSSITLNNGSVEVSTNHAGSKTMLLKPNQQAKISGNNIKLLQVNAEEFSSWKNGEFMFNNENLDLVMKKLSRWYNFNYSISNSLKGIKVWGSISRNEAFEKVLDIIKTTDKRILIKIEGREVILKENK